MNPAISVVIPTHNPSLHRLKRVLNALKQQTFPPGLWELVIIDNASSDAGIFDGLDLSWCVNKRIVREEKLGLAWARISGVKASKGDLLVFVDDDNVLMPDYLVHTSKIFSDKSKVGVIGGKIVPEYEIEPPDWFSQTGISLACCDFGDKEIISTYRTSKNGKKEYPAEAPVGAGMAIRRVVVDMWAKKAEECPAALILDRKGKSLGSGGDNDIIMTALDLGWLVGYFPELQLTHLIPKERLSVDYLARLNHDSSKSWIQVLDQHGINPWQRIPKGSLFLRQVKSFFFSKAWKNTPSYIRWRGACGVFEGLAELNE